MNIVITLAGSAVVAALIAGLVSLRTTTRNERLTEWARALRTEFVSWRFEHRQGLAAKQIEVGELASEANPSFPNGNYSGATTDTSVCQMCPGIRK